MKVIFLDVDGVLNSLRNIVANDRFPWPVSDSDVTAQKGPVSELDPLAIGMVRKLCKLTGAKIVFESTWRKHFHWQQFGEVFDLPMIDTTNPQVEPKSIAMKEWLETKGKELGVTNWIVIDDDGVFTRHDGWRANLSQEEQDKWLRRHIQTKMIDGFTFSDFARAFQTLEEINVDDVAGQFGSQNDNQGLWAMFQVIYNAKNPGEDALFHGRFN